MRGLLPSGAIISTVLATVLLLAVELHDTRRRLALETRSGGDDDAAPAGNKVASETTFRALSERAAAGSARERAVRGQELAAAAGELSLHCGAGPDDGGRSWEAHAAACLGAPAGVACSVACAAAAAPFAALRGVVAAAHDTCSGGAAAAAPPAEFSQETASQRRRVQPAGTERERDVPLKFTASEQMEQTEPHRRAQAAGAPCGIYLKTSGFSIENCGMNPRLIGDSEASLGQEQPRSSRSWCDYHCYHCQYSHVPFRLRGLPLSTRSICLALQTDGTNQRRLLLASVRLQR